MVLVNTLMNILVHTCMHIVTSYIHWKVKSLELTQWMKQSNSCFTFYWALIAPDMNASVTRNCDTDTKQMTTAMFIPDRLTEDVHSVVC
jgi:hypothetical protein